MLPTYGVLLVSFSRHSHQSTFVPLFREHPRVRIIAVADEADVEPELKTENRQWAAELDVPYIEGVDEALGLSEVDVVSIGHEIERRADLSMRAARAGKHLWIDKFTGASLSECDDVVATVADTGVKSIVPSYTYGELVTQSRDLIGSGTLGDLLAIHADVLFCKGRPRPPSPPRGDGDFLPAGRWKFPDIKRELLTVGAYSVGLIQSCFAPIAQVVAHGGSYFFPEHAAHHADDFGTMTMVDEDGRVATLCAGRIGVATHAAGGPLRAWLVGSQGSALVDAKRPLLQNHLSQRLTDTDYDPPPHDPMQWHSGPPTLATALAETSGIGLGLQDLVDALDEDRQPRYSVSDARDHMEILLAGYQSICSSQAVDLRPRP